MLSPRPLAALFSVAAFLGTGAANIGAHAAEIVHVVAKGQTLGRIAKRYHTTVESVREVNNLKVGQPLHPGLSLVIPEHGKEAQAAKVAERLRKGEDIRNRKDSGRDLGAKHMGGHKGDILQPKADPATDRGNNAMTSYAKLPARPGFVRMSRGSEKLEIQLITRHGRLVPSALPRLSTILRFYPTNAKTPIDPRLATLIGIVSDHFGGRPFRVVSGFRPYTPTQYTPHSNHNIGRAMDFSIDGVPNGTLRDFCRTFRNAGVGFYPNSSFVHMDVRAVKTFWIDYSRPGEAPHYDTPGGSPGADESTRDVDAPSDSSESMPSSRDPEEGVPGSSTTHPGPAEPADPSTGNSDRMGGSPERSPDKGHD